jgi:protein involved in polysaccharide export with SLBB domain
MRNSSLNTGRLGIALLAGVLVVAPGRLSAQNPTARAEATRAELEAIAAHPPKGMSAADLATVQQRLAKGDFAPGDRIAIQVEGEPTMTGTFTIAAGQTLVLPSMPPLALGGVLRSESDSVIREFIARYVRDPQVTVQPLLRLGMFGGVGKPGYYDVPATSLLSEAIMEAGGVSGTGQMSSSKVTRQNQVVLDSKAVSEALANGKSLDLLNMQSGDNLQVGEKGAGFMSTVGIVTAVLAIPFMIVSISALKH